MLTRSGYIDFLMNALFAGMLDCEMRRSLWRPVTEENLARARLQKQHQGKGGNKKAEKTSEKLTTTCIGATFSLILVEKVAGG